MVSAATPTLLAETASATLFVALELSRATWRVALHAPLTNKVSQHRLDGGDADGLLALIARKRGQAEEKLGRPVRVACCFEAGYDGFWLHRWLCARGVENRVLDAASLLVDRRARRGQKGRPGGGRGVRARPAPGRGAAPACGGPAGRGGQRRMGWTRRGCCARSWRWSAARRGSAAWCTCRRRSKRTRAAARASGPGWSSSAASTRAASRGC